MNKITQKKITSIKILKELTNFLKCINHKTKRNEQHSKKKEIFNILKNKTYNYKIEKNKKLAHWKIGSPRTHWGELISQCLKKQSEDERTVWKGSKITSDLYHLSK